jgi:ubiquinone/menaquinone biosynthesis C-methylase UbiE
MMMQSDPERRERKHLRSLVDLAGKRVLEIGCGQGRLTWQYALSTGGVVGIDLDVDDLRVATVDRLHALAEKVAFARADSVHLPFAKETFDIAILAWSL